MALRFDYRDVEFKRHNEGWLMVKGEITNSSGKNYSAVVFRIVIFLKNTPIGTTNLTVKGFYNAQTRAFEKQVEELKYDSVIGQRPACQIFVESVY